MNKVSLKDVAKRAGVGVGTASRVLNNAEHVSEEKRNLVLQAIKDLNYQPDAIARSLKTKTTKNIGVILNNITNPFYADLLRGLEIVAVEAGYSLLFVDMYIQKYEWAGVLNNLCNRKVDGIIYVGNCVTDEMAKVILKLPVPFVFTSTSVDVNEIDRKKIYSVDIDNEMAAYDVTKKLIEYGHRDIGIILGEEDDPYSTLYRYIGYKKALDEYNIEVNMDWKHFGDFTFESGYEAMTKILECEKIPTAIFAISDLMAIGASKAILESGRKIPDDISVFGFDGINNSKYFHPEIATVNQPRFMMGRLAAEKIIGLINKENDIEIETILSYELIIRESIKKI